MINESYKQRLYIFRSILEIYLKDYGEHQTIHVYFSKKTDQPIAISLSLEKDYINKGELKIYKVTIKNFYLYCLKEEYINTNWDILVLLANKFIKGYSSEQMAFLLGVALEKYNHLEMGYYTFVNELSYDNVAEKIEFNIKEFYFTFKDAFHHIEGGNY